MNPVVAVSGLCIDVSHGSKRRRVIESLDLDVHAGETFGLIGPSGCGKSTLLRTLAGIHRDWHGRIALLGAALSPGQPLRGELRLQVQLVFQDPFGSLHPQLRVRRALSEPLAARRVPHIDERLREALDEVDLPPQILPRFPHQLSGGQRQRVAIARALLARPRLLLLDEPSSALDMSVQAEILNLLNRVKAIHGVTLVLVSHDRGVIAHMCDRAADMRGGRLGRVLHRLELAKMDLDEEGTVSDE